MCRVYLETDTYIAIGETDERFFNQRTLVRVKILSNEDVRYADNKLIVLVAYTSSFPKLGSVVGPVDLELYLTQGSFPEFLRGPHWTESLLDSGRIQAGKIHFWLKPLLRKPCATCSSIIYKLHPSCVGRYLTWSVFEEEAKGKTLLRVTAGSQRWQGI